MYCEKRVENDTLVTGYDKRLAGKNKDRIFCHGFFLKPLRNYGSTMKVKEMYRGFWGDLTSVKKFFSDVAQTTKKCSQPTPL
jgi:hypothetical protein